MTTGERRIGELVPQGQREGTIAKRGDLARPESGSDRNQILAKHGQRPGVVHPRTDEGPQSAADVTGLAVAQLSDTYSLADAPAVGRCPPVAHRVLIARADRRCGVTASFNMKGGK
jgi:hypothetical protein